VVLAGALAGALAVMLGAARAAAPGTATVEARELEVPAPGWVRVALDGETQAAIPPGGGLAVLDPDGRAVPSRRVGAPRGTLPIALAETGETADGWSVDFDTGPLPLAYGRLVVTPTRETAAAVRVSGSDDRAAWTPLGSGSFVRLGDEAGLARTALDLPPSSFRYLRLEWPRSAGFPALEGAAVVLREEALPGAPSLAAPVRPASEPGSWRVELPAAGLRGVRLALRGAGLERAPLRLLAAREGRWEPLADVAACTAPCAIALDGGPLPSAVLRIEGETGGGLAIDGAALELEPAWLLFEAASRGSYRLVPSADEDGGPAPGPVEGPVAAVAPGAPLEAALPPLDADATELAPAGRMPRGWLSWPLVVPPDLAPGDVVRVEINDALLAQPGVLADGLRPMVGDRVVPFVLDTAAEPEPGAAVAATGGRATLPVGPADRGGVQVELRSAPGVRCEGEIDANWVRQPRPGVLDRGPAGTGAWSRGVAGAGPCLAFVALDLPEFATAVELAPRPGAAPPAAARSWRARHAVRFAWPDLAALPEGDRVVRLASGFDPLVEVAPRVRSVRRQLELRPAVPAAVDLVRTSAEIERMARLTRWALWGALAVAALVLLVVLGRGLSRGSAAT
jgi:hypothetical protein